MRPGILRFRGGRIPESTGGAAGEVLGVDADFPGDDGTAFLQCRDLRLDTLLMGIEQPQPFGLVARTLPHQLGEPYEIGQRHPGFAQLDADQQPVDIGGGVPPPATRRPLNRPDQQSLALVEAQSVHAEPGPLGHLTDAEGLRTCFGSRHTVSVGLELDLALVSMVLRMTLTDQQPLGSPFSATSTARDVLADIDLSGATALVTGGYSGLGLETARSLAAAGARVVVPARRPAEARAALADVDGCEVIPMDLADLGSVRTAAAQIEDRLAELDLVMALAGIMATPEKRVGHGWEGQLAVNHLGHFALVCELYPLLAAAGGARVVVNSSAGHTLTDIRWHDPHFRTGYDKWLAYGQAKTANALFAVHLDALGRNDGVRAFALHPGKIITGLQREMTRQEQIDRGWIDEHGRVIGADFKTPAQGAATGLWAATSALLTERGGLYLEDCEVARISDPGAPMDDGGVRAYAVDPGSAARLWELSVAATGATPITR